MTSPMNVSFSLTLIFLNSRSKKTLKHSSNGITMQVVYGAHPLIHHERFQIRREKVNERLSGPINKLLPNGNDVGVEGKLLQNRKFIGKRSRNLRSINAKIEKNFQSDRRNAQMQSRAVENHCVATMRNFGDQL